MKKLLSLLLCTAMISPFAVNASAVQTSAPQTTDPYVRESSAAAAYEHSKESYMKKIGFDAKAGDTITIYLKLKNSDKAAGLLGQLDFDRAYAEFTGVRTLYDNTFTSLVSPGNCLMFSTLFDESGVTIPSNSQVIGFDFQINEDISDENVIITYKINEYYDSGLNALDSDNFDCQVISNSDNHEHTIVTDPAKAPTCTQSGLTEGSHCSSCGEVIKEQSVIPPKGHTPTQVKGREATCTQTGLTDGVKCEVCGEWITEQKEIAMKEHTPVTIPAVAPTETSNGATEGTKCSVCGKILKEQETIGPIGHTHTIVIDESVPASCTQQGLTEGSHCSVCGETIKKQEDIPMLPHTFENGKCTVCGAPDPNSVKTLYGDIDGDSEISSSDALEVLRASVGLVEFDKTAQLLADVDGDKEVTSADSLAILRYSVDLPSYDIIGKQYTG